MNNTSESPLEIAARLAAIIECSDDAIISKTLQGIIASWNPAAARMFGYSADEIIGKPITCLFPPDRLEEETVILAKLQAGERIEHFETVRMKKDGTSLHVSATISPIRSAEGSIIGVSKILRDITQRRKFEQELLLLNACISNLNDIVLLTEAEPLDAPGPRIVFVNPAFERITGFTPAEALGRNPRFLQGPESNKEALSDIRRALERKEAVRREVINYKKSGESYWMDMDIVPVINSGKCTHFASIQRDITDRKQTEQRMAEQSELLDRARDAIMVRDLEGKILFWNQGAERIYGWSKQEAIGRNVTTFLYKEPKNFLDLTSRVSESGEWSGELQHLNKNGTILTVEARWTLVRDQLGRPKSILAINTDITDKKNVEAQFMRAQRMESIGTLASGIAHDLNNTLAPIMLSIGLLKVSISDPELQEILTTIEQSARRGSEIISQVLSFGRGLSGQRMEVQPAHLLKDVEQIIRDSFPKNIRLNVSVPIDAWALMADPTQIHQVILNLCVNARDAMPRGGSLHLSCENRLLDEQYVAMNLQAKVGPYVVITVTDTGEGIPNTIIDKIFEPFFTTKEVGKGTGLGLSTVNAIVKSHQGFLKVYSEVGRGTTFKIYLPSRVSSELAVQLSEAIILPRGNGELVLVVDDESSILNITGQTLQAFGYRVLLAKDGVEAVAIYARQGSEIALVLTDMMMPVMDGVATIQVIQRLNSGVKIIAASGLNANGNVAKATAAGVKYFLAKPYTAETLLKVVKSVLDEHYNVEI